MLPRCGEVLRIGREASVQFATSMLFRVVRVHDHPPHSGWIWLDGYQLDASGQAVAQRSIFVRVTGLRRAPARRR